MENNADAAGTTCLEEYCALLGYKIIIKKKNEEGKKKKKKDDVVVGAERQAQWEEILEKCPHALQIHQRSVRFHYMTAKGPVYARSFIRKILGNEGEFHFVSMIARVSFYKTVKKISFIFSLSEKYIGISEFCMQIDAATDFANKWDSLAIQQWTMTNNEYAILSNTPQSGKEREKKPTRLGGVVEEEEEVPRQCNIKIGSEGVPLYENIADGKAMGLRRPLLSTTFSSSFVFAKCHYETNVPHDPFAAQLLETEKFPRFARLWTRGYDVYTPAVNIVYHDATILHPLHHIAGHGDRGERKWPRNDVERRDAHVRMKVLLNIHHGISSAEAKALLSNGGGGGAGGISAGSANIGGRISTARANLGIYGLGRRRTLDQLLEFTGIALPGSDFTGQHGNDGRGCANPTWVPYDATISPRANLFDGMGMVDDLDADPEFPMRTLPDAISGRRRYDDTSFVMGDVGMMSKSQSVEYLTSRNAPTLEVPYLLILVLWSAGMCTWYGMFVGHDGKLKFGRGNNKQRHQCSGSKILRSSPRKPRRKANPLSERVVLKNV